MRSPDPVQPVDASTVILVRQAELPGSSWECFMVRRHVRSDFAADVFVFPGGKVDAADRDPSLEPFVQREPSRLRDCPPGEHWLPLQVAALRELFEEAGVLLARGANGEIIDLGGEEAERFAEYRRRLHSGAMTMLDLARAEELRFAGDLLYPFSRWITPVSFPRRFDTRFFVARLPAGQEPVHDALETTDGLWIAPCVALDRYSQGSFPLVFATEKHLERMARFSSVEQLIAAIRPADLEPVIPRMIRRGGETDFLIPGDEGGTSQSGTDVLDVEATEK